MVRVEKSDQILEELGRIKSGKDVLIWLPNAQGNFSTRSAWDCIRIRALKIPWMNWMWHPSLPGKMSIIMWKAMHGCLPVDDRIGRVGIYLVSKCDCCSSGGYEDQNHILALGTFAEQVWRICSLKLGMPLLEGRTWREKIECWYQHVKNSSQSGQLIGILPSIYHLETLVASVQGKNGGGTRICAGGLGINKILAGGSRGED